MSQHESPGAFVQGVVEECVRNFERAWNPASLDRAESILQGLDAPRRGEALTEIIRVDMELRREHGDPETLEYYLDRFPELRTSTSHLSEVAFEDYRLQIAALGDRESGPRLTPVMSPAEYARLYSIDVSSWPLQSACPHGNPPDSHSVVGESVPIPPRLPRIGDCFCGFRLIGLLGTGGCGKVYLAKQGDLANRLVSLKVTTQESHESLFLARLQHTNIVPVYSVHQQAQCNAICMPFLGLATLKDVIAMAWNSDPTAPDSRSCQALLSTVNQNRFDCVLDTIPDDQERDRFLQTARPCPSEVPDGLSRANLSWINAATEIAALIAEGLAHAHEQGIVHGDIKPANVLITDDGQPVLLDFHLSRLTSGDALNPRWIGGTLPYMSPQQLQGFIAGGRGVDTRSDVYSAGIVLYELLTGRLPWAAPETGDLADEIPRMVQQRLTSAAPNPRSVDRRINPDLASIVSKCLEPDTADRYQNAGQLQRDLRLHLNHRSPVTAPRSSPAERTRKFFRRHPRLLSLSSLAIVSVLVTAILSWSLVVRSSRLARAEALQTSNQFLSQLQNDKLQLSVIADDQTRMDRITQRARQLLASFTAGTAAELRASARYRYLPAAQQERESRAAGNMHFWLAESLRRKAAGSADESTRLRFLDLARQENEFARQYADGDSSLKAQQLQLAMLLRDQGNPDHSNQIRQQAMQQPSQSGDDHLMSAWLLQFDDPSIELAEMSIEKSPLNFTAWIVAGNIFLTHELTARAIACYTVATALAPDQARAHYFLARAEMDAGDPEAALQAFDRALELDPDDDAIWLNRGLCLMALGQHADAERAWSRAIDLGTHFTRAWYLRAGVRRQLGNESGSASDMQLFTSTEPRDATSYLTRGALHAQTAPELALADFEQARRLDPRSPQAWQNLAYVYAEVQDDLPNALAMMDGLVDLDPGDANQIATRGVLHARMGNAQRALADASVALRLAGDNAETQYRVAGIHARLSVHEPRHSAAAFQLIGRALLQDPQKIMDFMTRDPDIGSLQSSEQWTALELTLNQLKNLAKTGLFEKNGTERPDPPNKMSEN